MKQRIALLGSTGSIGVQTLDIVRENPEQFEITALVANRNWEIPLFLRSSFKRTKSPLFLDFIIP